MSSSASYGEDETSWATNSSLTQRTLCLSAFKGSSGSRLLLSGASRVPTPAGKSSNVPASRSVAGREAAAAETGAVTPTQHKQASRPSGPSGQRNVSMTTVKPRTSTSQSSSREVSSLATPTARGRFAAPAQRVVSEAQPAPSTFSVRAAGAHQVPRTPTTVRHLTALQTRQASQQLPPSSNNCASTEHVPQHETQQGAASSGAGAWGTGSQRPSHLNVRPVTSNTSADSEVSSYNSLSSSFRTGTSYTTSTSCRVSELPFMAQVLLSVTPAREKLKAEHEVPANRELAALLSDMRLEEKTPGPVTAIRESPLPNRTVDVTSRQTTTTHPQSTPSGTNFTRPMLHQPCNDVSSQRTPTPLVAQTMTGTGLTPMARASAYPAQLTQQCDTATLIDLDPATPATGMRSVRRSTELPAATDEAHTPLLALAAPGASSFEELDTPTLLAVAHTARKRREDRERAEQEEQQLLGSVCRTAGRLEYGTAPLHFGNTCQQLDLLHQESEISADAGLEEGCGEAMGEHTPGGHCVPPVSSQRFQEMLANSGVADETPPRTQAHCVAGVGSTQQQHPQQLPQPSASQAQPARSENSAPVASASYQTQTHSQTKSMRSDGLLCKPAPMYGSMALLSPVRASKAMREELGSEVVLTPVRRSARTQKASTPAKDKPSLLCSPISAAKKGSMSPSPAMITGESCDAAALLEATNFCYAPNVALPNANIAGVQGAVLL